MTAIYPKYGDFEFQPGEATLRRYDVTTRRSSRGWVEWLVYDVFLEGTVVSQNCDELEINQRLSEIIQAFSEQGKSLKFILSDGTESVHSLTPQDADAGPYLVTRNWPQGGAGEMVDHRDFTIHMRMEEYRPESQISEYWERVQVQGSGGPLWNCVPTAIGNVDQIRYPATPQVVIQTGSAMGLAGYVSPASALFPSRVIDPRSTVTLATPVMNRGSFFYYRSDWSYYMSLATPSNNTVPVPF